METEDDRLSFTLREIASFLDLSEQQLGQLIQDGHIPSGVACGQYHLQDVVRGYVRFLNRQRRGKQRGVETSRLAAAQATRVELENFRRMGALQTMDQVMETCIDLVVLIKRAHDGLPGRLSCELASISEPPQIYRRLQDELRAIDSQCDDFLEKRVSALGAMFDPCPRYPPAREQDTEPDEQNPIG